MRRSIPALTTFALAAALLVPIGAFAAEEPQAIDDPVAAFDPAVPGADAPAADPEPKPEVAVETDDMHTLEAPVAAPAATAVPAATVASGNGSLPFTGLDSQQLVLLFLVGSLLACAGATLLALPGRRIPAR